MAAAAAAATAETQAAAAPLGRRASPPLLVAALRTLLGGVSGGVDDSRKQQQHQQQHQQQQHNNRYPAATAARSFASSANDENTLHNSSGGRPPPNVTDAQFTSEQEQQQQRQHRAAALRSSMDALVDAAVEAVERGEPGRAVEVLEQGLKVLGSEHGEAPELGELHNQAALLLLLQSTGDGGGGGDEEGGVAHPLERAAEHASQALRLTERAFGAAHPLTGHRLLRLGTIRLAQGRAADASPLLAAAADMLGGGGGSGGSTQQQQQQQQAAAFGPGLAEARFHLALIPLSSARASSAVAQADDLLASSLAELVSLLGPDSMIVRLALAQHSAVVGQGLEAAAALIGGGGGGGGGAAAAPSTSSPSGAKASLALSEALLKQHAKLQEQRDRGSAELGLARYQLAVLYYAHDLLDDARRELQRAKDALSAHVPETHDVSALLRHRAGMIAAAKGEHRAAEALLSASAEHYGAQARAMMVGGGGGEASSAPPPVHPLQREAEFGLAIARLKGVEGGEGAATAKEELLARASEARRDVARALGGSHLLSLGAARYEAQARARLGVGAGSSV